MTIVIADCETDGLLDRMSRLWTIQIGDADGDDAIVYADQPGYPPLAEGIRRLQAAEKYVFHNGLGFDFWAINRVFPGALDHRKVFDTLVAARLWKPDERNHSLKAWGARLKCAKGDYTGDFSRFDDELVTYARQDILVGRALYHAVRLVETWGESCELEHDVTWAVILQQRNGFHFDIAAAQALDAELRGTLTQLEKDLQGVFPPVWVKDGKEITNPKRSNSKTGQVAGAPFSKVKLQPFNPGSRQQVGKRLMALGWKPREFGANGCPTVDEGILKGLKYPQAQELVKYFTIAKTLGQVADGDNGWLRLVGPDNRIHGRVNPNGAVTGRMTHLQPNVAQTPAVRTAA